MNIIEAPTGITRRQFFKGAGLIAGFAVLTALSAKIGFSITARNPNTAIKARIAGIYQLDNQSSVRTAHENPSIDKLKQVFSEGFQFSLNEAGSNDLIKRSFIKELL